MKFKIEKATVDDAGKIADFTKHMLLYIEKLGWRPVNRSTRKWKEIVTRIRETIASDPKQIFLVAKTENRAIGFSHGVIEDLPDVLRAKRTLHISAVFVEKAFRNLGIGEALVERLIQRGKKASAKEVNLRVHVKNPAIKLYRKLGFEASRSEMAMEI